MCSVLVSFLPSALVRRPGPGRFARLLPQGALRRCNVAPGSAQVCRGTFVGAAGVPPRLDLEVCKACEAHLAIAATQDFPPPSLSVTSWVLLALRFACVTHTEGQFCPRLQWFLHDRRPCLHTCADLLYYAFALYIYLSAGGSGPGVRRRFVELLPQPSA